MEKCVLSPVSRAKDWRLSCELGEEHKDIYAVTFRIGYYGQICNKRHSTKILGRKNVVCGSLHTRHCHIQWTNLINWH